MGALMGVDSPYMPWSFVLVTVLLGGAAAYAAGRALAQTWRPLWQAFAYAAALAAVAGFLHYVLFSESVIPGARIAGLAAQAPANPAAAIGQLATALRPYAIILATLSAIALAGYRITRARAMERQYGFDR